VYQATEEVLGPLTLADLVFGLQAVAKKHRQQQLAYSIKVWQPGKGGGAWRGGQREGLRKDWKAFLCRGGHGNVLARRIRSIFQSKQAAAAAAAAEAQTL